MKILLAIIVAFILTGCATSPEYSAYLQAQSEANRQAAADQKPLVRITAQPGQQITGLHSLEVYTPTAAPVVQQQRPNEWAAVVGQAISVGGGALSMAVGGKALVDVAKEIRTAGTAGYPFVQAPTTTMSNSTGVLGSGTYAIDSTHTPTVVIQPDPTIITQPAPMIVNQPAPIVVRPEVVQTGGAP